MRRQCLGEVLHQLGEGLGFFHPPAAENVGGGVALVPGTGQLGQAGLEFIDRPTKRAGVFPERTSLGSPLFGQVGGDFVNPGNCRGAIGPCAAFSRSP